MAIKTSAVTVGTTPTLVARGGWSAIRMQIEARWDESASPATASERTIVYLGGADVTQDTGQVYSYDTCWYEASTRANDDLYAIKYPGADFTIKLRVITFGNG